MTTDSQREGTPVSLGIQETWVSVNQQAAQIALNLRNNAQASG
jgi:hypothetical protein